MAGPSGVAKGIPSVEVRKKVKVHDQRRFVEASGDKRPPRSCLGIEEIRRLICFVAPTVRIVSRFFSLCSNYSSKIEESLADDRARQRTTPS